jgi:integrase
MASIVRQDGGRRLITFFHAGKRKSIRLGKMSQRDAGKVKDHIEALILAQDKGTGTPPETASWLTRIGPEMADKLARQGLISKREAVRLADFLDSYIKSRGDTKKATRINYGHTRRCLIEYFGADKPLGEISPGDADAWRAWMASEQKLADNTVRRRTGNAKQFFRVAVRRRIIPENPFDGLCSATKGNPSRFYFVTREEAAKVLEACPDAQWRLLFALSRYGGLRCPSEHLRLTWDDVDWERGRLTVHSPKTEHHEGGESRVIPIFPELRPYLDEVYFRTPTRNPWIITRCRDSGVNLRTMLMKIIKRAGLKPWPKLWQNLRSTRQTELAETFPIQVVCQWIGNTQAVALKHYLQVTDKHFEAAIKGGEREAQKAQQYTLGNPCKPLEHETANPGFTGVYEGLQGCTTPQVGDSGLEPPTPSLSSWCSNQLS